MTEVTYINRNGQTVGREVYDPATGYGASFPAEGPAPLGVVKPRFTDTISLAATVTGHTNAGSSWFSDAVDFVASIFSTPAPSLSACDNGTGSVGDEWPDGGIPMDTPDTDGDDECTESGACITDDGGVILPTDTDGNPILPDDIWFSIEGQGSFFQETPAILMESGYITGQNLQDLTLRVELGTDSTLIDTMPADGCFDGMININQLSDEDIANGVPGCPEDGYETFTACPSDESNRLRVYVAGYTIEGYTYVGGEYQMVDSVTETLTNVEELFADLDAGQTLPVVCGDSPTPFIIPIPASFNENGDLFLKLRFNLIVDAREADQSAAFQTKLGVRIKEAE
ncbi:MAG: hypothetical protein WC529_04040 [Candidatus Margulisiibacteriota bacterium]